MGVGDVKDNEFNEDRRAGLRENGDHFGRVDARGKIKPHVTVSGSLLTVKLYVFVGSIVLRVVTRRGRSFCLVHIAVCGPVNIFRLVFENLDVSQTGRMINQRVIQQIIFQKRTRNFATLPPSVSS